MTFGMQNCAASYQKMASISPDLSFVTQDEAIDADSQESVTEPKDGLKLIKHLAPEKNSKILDLGCGGGRLAVALGEYVGPGGKVVGVDPDKESIKSAKEKYASSNVEFLEADGETFPEDQYDIIFANHSIHWIEDKDAVFKRVLNNLRPGGRFAFTATDRVFEVCLAIMQLTGGPEEVKSITDKCFPVPSERYEELAMAHGYSIAYMETATRSHQFANIDAILECLSEGSLEAVDKDALEDFKKPYGDKPLLWSYPYFTFILTKP